MVRVFLIATLAVAVAACSINTLGGREKCWPESDPRAASIWRGTLVIEEGVGRLATPEGDVIPLRPGGGIGFRVGSSELVRGTQVLARGGDEVTLFGGAGGDGSLVVCGVEEVHAGRGGGG